MIEEFMDEFKSLITTSNKIKELELLREQEMDKIKNETKREQNMLDDEISDILETLDVNLTTLELRCSFCKKPYDVKKEIELKSSVKEKINEIERLKEEVENSKDELLDHLFDDESIIFKLLTDLKYEKGETLHDIAVLESKLRKLETSPGGIKKLILSS